MSYRTHRSSGYVGTKDLQNFQNIVERAYRSYRSSGYGYECRTELTEVLRTGLDVVQNSQKFRAREIPGKIHAFGGGVRFEVQDFIQLEWHVLTGPTPPRQSVVAVWALSTTTTEVINHEPQRMATGATAALTGTVLQQIIVHRTPAVAPQKKSWRSQAQICHQLDRRSATTTTTKRSYRKHRG